jgi:hypothetical protein
MVEERAQPAVSTARSLKTTARRATSIIIDNMLASGLMLIPLASIFFSRANLNWQWIIIALAISPLPIIYFRLFFKVWNNMPTPGEAISGIHVVQETYPLRTKDAETAYAFWQWLSVALLVVVGSLIVYVMVVAYNKVDYAAWLNIVAMAFIYVFIRLFDSLFSKPHADMLERIHERPNKTTAIINQVDYERLGQLQLQREENPPVSLTRSYVLGCKRSCAIAVDCILVYVPFVVACILQHWFLVLCLILPIGLPVPLMLYRRFSQNVLHWPTLGQLISGSKLYYVEARDWSSDNLLREYFFFYIAYFSLLFPLYGFWIVFRVAEMQIWSIAPAFLVFAIIGTLIWRPDRSGLTQSDRWLAQKDVKPDV